jgi:hypothetical protein
MSEGRPRWATAAGLVFFYPLVAFAALGALLLRRQRRPVWPLAVPIAITAVASAMFWGQTRFRAPAEPVLVVLVGNRDRLAARTRFPRSPVDPAPNLVW